MNILFLVFHGFSPHSGISKKIHSQVEGLRESGHHVSVCHYRIAANGHRQRMVDEEVIADYGVGKLAALRQRLSYGSVYRWCRDHQVEMVYARSFMNASPSLISLFSKLRKTGIRSVMEVPTYPYDAEFEGFPLTQRLGLMVDQLFRGRLARELEAIVTFSEEQVIFGQGTIRISNGVDFSAIPLHQPPVLTPCSPVHLIGVAEVHYWHGYDRLIAGLGEYYLHGGDTCRPVYFHIVGGVGESEMMPSRHTQGFAPLIARYHLEDKVIFHGQLFGDSLTEVFNTCSFAIGSLARHRSGITQIKTLKNREYATRGLPFIYSEQDADFDHQPYILKASPDERPVDIQAILTFLDHFQLSPERIRATVTHLSWKNQMNEVVKGLRR